MLLIPQIYLRNGKVVRPDGTTSPLFNDDPLVTVESLKAHGAEALHIVDVSLTPAGASPHIPLIQKISDETGMAIYVSGSFKTAPSVEAILATGIEMVILQTAAYQQPEFLADVARRFPARIGVHIEMKGGHVTIPGYAALTMKSSIDYAEQFIKSGVRYILYTDVGTGGFMEEENLVRLAELCKAVPARILCASEVQNIEDVELVAHLPVPRLDGLVLARSLYEGRIDLRAAVIMLADLSLNSDSEATMTEM